MDTSYNLTLTMFDGGAGAGAGAAGAAGTGAGAPASDGAAPDAAAPKAGKEEVKIVYGKAVDESDPVEAVEADTPDAEGAEESPADPDAEFDKLIAGKMKGPFSKKVQAIVDQRFKETKAMEARIAKITPAMKLLGEKYGVDPTNDDALAAAIQNDDSFYEDAAIQSGLTVEAYKEIQRKDRELQQYKTAEEQRLQKERLDTAIKKQVEEARQVAQIYPGFDLKTELANPMFLRMVHPDNPYAMDIRTAYEVVHRDDIQQETVRHTAQRAQKETADNIRARGLRPAENGTGGHGAAVIRKQNVNELTDNDLAEISKRAKAGETIRF